MMLASIEKKKACCEECGWSGHPSGFSFHHIGEDKEFTISRSGSVGWGKVLSELSKCRLLCRNCHNRQHSNRFDGERFELAMAPLKKRPISVKMVANRKSEPERHCCFSCGDDIGGLGKTGLCPKCYQFTTRRVERPSCEDLKVMIAGLSFCEIGRRFGVSDNAVRKWAKSYGLIGILT